MKLHSPLAAKRLRSYLRVAFFMIRKGLISKRKLIIDINLLMKRGKLIGKALGNHVFNIHHHGRPRGYGYGLQEYEFSCSDSPNPVFFHAKRGAHRNYFPCISAMAEEDDERPPIVPSSAAAAAAALPRLDYSPNSSVVASEEEEEAEEEIRQVSFENNEVDDEAEEFIRRFYEQLRRQSRFALLQYEIDYRAMLARGC
ncbi:hypothetical protein KFK09_011201 [Dendrobium nobile]|uniref:DUF761 domain-containing protein n=1 Tax=Dendrobium nobile TaxID=94219 RepID=A0A8T3BDX0_DENNO|nr:hypothetical protein KFK09_011201 [Dendrobium nobile]